MSWMILVRLVVAEATELGYVCWGKGIKLLTCSKAQKTRGKNIINLVSGSVDSCCWAACPLAAKGSSVGGQLRRRSKWRIRDALGGALIAIWGGWVEASWINLGIVSWGLRIGGYCKEQGPLPATVSFPTPPYRGLSSFTAHLGFFGLREGVQFLCAACNASPSVVSNESEGVIPRGLWANTAWIPLEAACTHQLHGDFTQGFVMQGLESSGFRCQTGWMSIRHFGQLLGWRLVNFRLV